MDGRPGEVLKILIVEDDVQLATTLKYLVEDNPRYRVVATANDLDSAVAAAQHGTTGFSVAVRMGDFDIPCFFITGKAPDFPMPDLALGCLMKPFTAEDIHRSLAAAEDIMRGREALRPKMPVNLTLYDKVDEERAEQPPGFIPSKRSLKTRLEHWISGTQH